MNLSTTVILKILVFFESLVLAYLTVYKDPNNKTNQLFTAYIFVIAFVSFTEIHLAVTDNIETFLFWKNFDLMIFLALPILFHFTLIYTYHPLGRKKKLIKAVYLVFILFIIGEWYFAKPVGAVKTPWGFNSMFSETGMFYHYLVAIISFILAAYSIAYNLFYFYKTKMPSQKLKSGLISFSLLFIVLAGGLLEIIFPLVLKKATPLGATATSAFILANPVIAFAVYFLDVLRTSPQKVINEITHLMNDILILTTSHGKIEFINDSGLQYLRTEKQSVVGTSLDHILIDSQNKEELSLFKTEESSPVITIDEKECLLKPFTGKLVPVSFSVSPYFKKPFGLQGYVFIIRDIQQKKRIEKLKINIERILRHDLRSTLTGILGLPATIKDDPNLTLQQKEIIEMIENSGQLMLNQINAYLKMQTISYSKTQHLKEQVDIFLLISYTLKLLANKANEKKLSFLVMYHDKKVKNNDHFTIKSDRTLLFSLLSNLITNAIEASPQNSDVAINLKTQNHLLITIHNQGEIPEEIRHNFFEEFVTYGKASGTGLGTYSARFITELLGGEINFNTNKSEGTTLLVKLPIVE